MSNKNKPRKQLSSEFNIESGIANRHPNFDVLSKALVSAPTSRPVFLMR